jgi:trk system potassium uptake protein TrkH
MTKLNRKLIFYIIGLLLLFNGIAMLSSSLVSLITNDGVLKEVTVSAVFTIVLGCIIMSFTKSNIRQINKRDGYISYYWMVNYGDFRNAPILLDRFYNFFF